MDLRVYGEMIALFLDSGYQVTSFQEIDGQKTEHRLILRHDVDVSVDCALQMAQVEKELGVRSIYFFLLTSPLYNLLSKEAAKQVRAIHELGHEIGLHFDPDAYPSDAFDHVQDELTTLVSFYPFANPIWISFHRPGPKAGQLSELKLPGGIRHTYETQFFAGLAYFSDSRGSWGRGNPVDSEEFKQGKSMQVLTHPVWWVHEGQTPQEKLERFVLTAGDCFRRMVVGEVFP
jgi:hypothetical protein